MPSRRVVPELPHNLNGNDAVAARTHPPRSHLHALPLRHEHQATGSHASGTLTWGFRCGDSAAVASLEAMHTPIPSHSSSHNEPAGCADPAPSPGALQQRTDPPARVGVACGGPKTRRSMNAACHTRLPTHLLRTASHLALHITQKNARPLPGGAGLDMHMHAYIVEAAPQQHAACMSSPRLFTVPAPRRANESTPGSRLAQGRPRTARAACMPPQPHRRHRHADADSQSAVTVPPTHCQQNCCDLHVGLVSIVTCRNPCAHIPRHRSHTAVHIPQPSAAFVSRRSQHG